MAWIIPFEHATSAGQELPRLPMTAPSRWFFRNWRYAVSVRPWSVGWSTLS